MDYGSDSSESDREVLALLLSSDEEGPPRHYKIRNNYMVLLTSRDFEMRFRLNKTMVEELVVEIQPHLRVTGARNHGVLPINQLLLALRFYALGTMLLSVADFAGVTKSTASRIVRDVSCAISQLYNKYIFIKDDTEQHFYDIAQFPRVLGAIDGTHVRIQSPCARIGEEFRNRKGYFSLNVQAVCDANLLLMNVVARWPGSAHDATIFNNSELRGMKMTMSTTATMSARVHRKVMRAPHKRAHPGKMPAHPGKMAAHPGKMAAHSGKMASHSGNIMHPGKLSHFGRFGKLQHYAQTTHTLRPPEPCGDSNDSGLGPDHDQRNALNRLSESGEEWGSEPKRCRSDEDLKLESDDAIDAYTFGLPPPPAYPAPVANDSIRAGGISSPGRVPESPGKRFQDASYRSCGKLGSGKLATKYSNGGKLVGGKLAGGGKLGGKLGGKYGGKLAQALARRRALATMHGPPAMAAPITNRSRDGTVELQILCQPESQHRARYQTEGSRGAVKDNSGNGFPMVKLAGYDKPAVLQVYIGTDTGRVAPHMFYQACRVSGKNSTPCKERKEDGTVIIEIDLEPAKNWQVTCDCVGILKERNVDVEHRFGDSMSGGAHVSRGKKKSTRCRMVFRTDIINREGIPETLQVCSTQIICTQPPGVPEVCRKSLMSCPASGGLELYLLGKNFLKETRVVFSQRQDGQTVWEKEVIPDKEFLQQSHLVCCVPPYGDISEPVGVQLFVRSGGRASEPHAFYYTPTAMDSGPQHCTTHHAHHAHHAGHTNHAGHAHGEDARPVFLWGSGGLLAGRRGSLIVPDEPLKVELSEEGSRDVDAEGVVDLRLKSEGSPFVTFAEAMEPPSAPLVSFTQQLQAIQTQVQTDKMVESVTAAIFNTDDAGGPMYAASVMSAPADLGAHHGGHGGHGGGHSTPEAKLDELVNARADDHLAGDEHVKTPPAAVKSMILTAAAEILTSDSTMNALVTSAMNTANILTEPAEPAAPPEAPLAACAAAVSAAVTQAVSQAVSHAVSHAVTQEMAAPVQRLTDMSDNDLLSYINPSAFDQV